MLTKPAASLSLPARARESQPPPEVEVYSPQPSAPASQHPGLLLAARMLLAVGLLYCLYAVASQAIALAYFRFQPLPLGLQQALRWDPGNPRYYALLGRFYQHSPQEADLDLAIHFYQQATRRSPLRASYWADLGAAYELAGRTAEARHAYEHARQLFPHSPRINWRLANFYLRLGRLQQALPVLRPALAGDPELRRPAFDLAWRAGADPALILDTMLPPDPQVFFEYLRYLVQTDRLDSAQRVWNRLLALHLPFQTRAAFFYLDALIDHRRLDALTAAWTALQERDPQLTRPRPHDRNLIPNHNFESNLLNGGLGWRVRPVAGAVVSLDSSTFLDGARSLRIQFDGKHNLDYAHVFLYLPVQPQTRYRFIGYLRTRDLTTDSGPRFELLDVYDRSRFFLSSPSVVGSRSWTRQQLEFQTGPDTRLLLLRLTRPPSRKLDNRIAGTVWIDRVSLYAVQ
ncbi:MAG: tetratricopeptide repeat protein [Candidatus Acidoferrales bacterium]